MTSTTIWTAARSRGWISNGRGVIYQQVHAGPAILITYGGDTTRLSDGAA